MYTSRYFTAISCAVFDILDPVCFPLDMEKVVKGSEILDNKEKLRSSPVRGTRGIVWNFVTSRSLFQDLSARLFKQNIKRINK